jgi:hypothetical protein
VKGIEQGSPHFTSELLRPKWGEPSDAMSMAPVYKKKAAEATATAITAVVTPSNFLFLSMETKS